MKMAATDDEPATELDAAKAARYHEERPCSIYSVALLRILALPSEGLSCDFLTFPRT